MELFDKIYSCYYNVVRHILEEAAQGPVTKQDMERLCRDYAYQESALTIVPKLTEGIWPLLQNQAPSAWASRLKYPPVTPPLTSLQLSWLKALLGDSRFQLFFTDEELMDLHHQLDHIPVAPLYSQDDFYYYDRYRDGDSFHSLGYREHFQTILEALREKRLLSVAYIGKKKQLNRFTIVPCNLQYSSKDDKFRLCCLQKLGGMFRRSILLNLERIVDIKLDDQPIPENTPVLSDPCFIPVNKAAEPVLLQISGERNSLERCMLHFANYEKHTEYDETNHCWLCSIYYDMADETELLIDVLSFGPVIRVLGPESFLAQVRNRVNRQHHLFYDPRP